MLEASIFGSASCVISFVSNELLNLSKIPLNFSFPDCKEKLRYTKKKRKKANLDEEEAVIYESRGFNP